MNDGRIVFEITGDNTSLKQALKSTTADIENESKKWDKAVDDSSGKMSGSMTDAFTTVVKSAAFVKITEMILKLSGESIQLASDLEEVQNVVDVTFGEAGAKKIESWAKTAGDQFGLTELQAKKYASTLGAMMKSSGMASDEIQDMSMNLAGLAADMASFYNLPFDEAFSKIQSGMSGMSQPLRQLGIDMTESSIAAYAMAEGYDTAFSSMSNQEQTLVRYKYLMKVTADAQGDFVRTSDSYANSQRRVATAIDTLKAKFGQGLLPIATDVSNAIGKVIEALAYTPPETAFDKAEAAMADAAGQAAQSQGIIAYMDKLIEKNGEAAKETQEWATALNELKTVFPEVNKYIDAETGALTASNEQLKQYVENSKQAAIEDAKKAAVADLNEQYVTAGKNYYVAEVKRDIAQSEADAAREALVNYINSRLYEGEEKMTDTGFLTIDQLKWIAQDRAREFGDSQDSINEWVRIFNEQTKVANEQNNEMTKLSGTISSLEADIAIANEALDRLSSAASLAANALEGAGTADGSHAGGLDYVPFDGYHAILHRGERIQTAAEASLTRQYGNAAPVFDYASFGAAMWADAPKMGGNVYLDGRVVGSVISDQQGRSYRQLQRSGWQG